MCPSGNVYYYFKTKDELVDAAIAAPRREVQDEARGPGDAPDAEGAAEGVRPHAGRAARADRPVWLPAGHASARSSTSATTHSAAPARELMRLPIEWAERQFRAMGRRDARELAFALIASYQGIALLTNTFRDPELMAREGARLERWIDGLA